MGQESRILVVDDDSHVRHAVSRLLQQAGYEVLEAGSGEDGLRLTQEHNPDLVLLDVVLPGTNGVEVCRRIKTTPDLAGVCVILLSDSEITPDSQTESLEAGADGYIAKPFSSREFLARVQALLRLRQAEEALAWESRTNAAIAQVSKALLSSVSVESISDLVLEHAKQLTGSVFGYVGYIDPQTRRMISSTMTRDIWDTCYVVDKDVVFEKFAGLWGWVLKNRQSLLTNDPKGDPRSSGVPEGHISIHRFLSAPALLGDALLGQVALANPSRDYTARDLEVVERLASLYALAVNRQWTENALLEHQRQLEDQNMELRKLTQAIEQSANTVVITDLEGRIEYVNPKFEETTGYTAAEARGQNPRLLKSGAQNDAYYRDLWQTITTGQEWRGEFHNRRKDGTLYWELATIAPVYDAAGQMTHFIAVKEDITARKHAEEVVRLNEARLASLYELSQREFQTEKELIDYALEEAVRITGSTIGYYHFVQPDQVNLALYTWSQRALDTCTVSTERHYPLEMAGVWADCARQRRPVIHNDYQNLPDKKGYPEGHSHIVRHMSTPVIDRGHVVAIAGVANKKTPYDEADVRQLQLFLDGVWNIIVRKRAEEQLQRYAAELQRSNQELEHFAYVISHDLSEPLRMVTSYLHLLEQRYTGQLDERGHQFIYYAVDGASRMQEMIQALLNLSRVSTRGREFAPTDCEALLARTLRDLQIAIQENRAAVTHDPLPTVPADESQLAQVFQNLVGNAVKFHGAEPPRVHVSAEQMDSEWCFSVQDNGIGIDPMQVDRIFQIFQRLHTREEYEGTGIGLALCKKIVERHGGRIWVESEPDQGATFYFTLPA